MGPFGLEVAATAAARLPQLKAFMYEGPHGDCHTAFADLRVPSLQVLVSDAKQVIIRTYMRCIETSYQYIDISWGLFVPAQTLALQALRMVTEFSDYSDANQHDLQLMVAKQSQQQPPHLAEGATSAEDGAVRRAFHAACDKTAANQVLGASPCRSAEMGVTGTGRTRMFRHALHHPVSEQRHPVLFATAHKPTHGGTAGSGFSVRSRASTFRTEI